MNRKRRVGDNLSYSHHHRNLGLLMVCLTILLVMQGLAWGSAETSVGVKAGDWVEYKIDYSYSRSPLIGPYETWIRLEVLSVQGTVVTLKLTKKYPDGSQPTETSTVDINVESANVDVRYRIRAVIIPANLTVGDAFYSGNEDIGDIMIDEVGERTCAGARRTVVHAMHEDDYYAHGLSYWDKKTGVLMETTLYDEDYLVLTVRAVKTNMWQAQLFGLDPFVFYTLVIVAIAIVATFVFFIIRRRKPSP